MTTYHIGTSGWHYEGWEGLFYPPGLPKALWLDFYSQRFPTVELNNSFYRLPTERAFASWRDGSPSGFLFAVKVSRFITHIKRLKDCREPLETFFSRARALKDKLGPFLYQLPPQMRRNDALLEAFLSLLPPQHRHVFEFRHESWFQKEAFDLLSRYGVGFCVQDMKGCETPVVATADFAYVRFHGTSGLYAGSYTDEELADWAEKIGGLEVNSAYIYFNNDVGGHAVFNAQTLSKFLKG